MFKKIILVTVIIIISIIALLFVIDVTSGLVYLNEEHKNMARTYLVISLEIIVHHPKLPV